MAGRLLSTALAIYYKYGRSLIKIVRWSDNAYDMEEKGNKNRRLNSIICNLPTRIFPKNLQPLNQPLFLQLPTLFSLLFPDSTALNSAKGIN